ncbi:MAG: hypothetical protein KC427_01725 [Sulfurovum sp.]|nr:hypothetical protein [Sulfurovum sp.]MCO4844720.1 hypothetical protein [Sulfurovum sp.]
MMLALVLYGKMVYIKTNTYKWFKDNTYELESSHDISNLPLFDDKST